jgi:hypothetical protein
MRRASLLSILVLAVAARADLPSPRFDRLTPLGAAAGSSVEVEVAGADLDDARRLFFDHPGITAEHLKDRKFRVTVIADVPAGTYDARLVGKYGLSSPRLFAVSHGFAEVAKKGKNYDAESAQSIAVNSIVNGNTDGNREDVYRFPAKKGQRVVVECQAQQLDSALDATLTLADAAGKPLASNSDYIGRDPLVDFVAPRDGEYFVSLADLSYRGGLPYRLLVTDRPRVENVFPRAVQVGKPATLTVFGRNLGPKARPSTWAVNDLPLDELTETVTPPADVFAAGGFRFTDHPCAHSVLPTAATCTLTGFQFRGVPLVLTDTPVTLEQEPNDDPTKPQRLSLPAVLSGRFDRERDADWYEFATTEDGQYAFEVYCERIAGRADPYLAVVDEKDNRVAELDDFGIRANAFDGHLRDPSGTANLQGKKKYRVLVQDRYRRGGARYQYVLAIHKKSPDFYPAVIHHQNPGPGGTTVRRGGATSLDVVIHFMEGFDGPVTIAAEGLPKGLHAAPTTIRNNLGSIVLWADADAPEWVGPIQLIATGKSGDVERKREVRPYTRVHQEANQASSRPTRELIVATLAEPAPFALAFEKDRVEVEAGKKATVSLRCDRLWSEFKGNVTVIPLSPPNQVKMGAVSIAEGKGEATVTFEVQKGAKPGEYTLAVAGQAQVPVVKEMKGAATKTSALVALPSRPLTLVVKAAGK